MKQARPILVVLGNPPYNAFAGTSPAEESGLVVPYKEGLQRDWGIRKFNLDDLYVRFFRIAERRIAEGTGRGIVCFISNHSWLWYPSYVVMRKRLLAEFDRVWVDNLNGSKFETGKVAPDGSPDPSVFSTDANREGIQVGTAVALLVKRDGSSNGQVMYRDLWGTTKRTLLIETLVVPKINDLYKAVYPSASNRFILRRSDVAIAYASWSRLPELATQNPTPGLLEMRRESLINQDLNILTHRMRRYFDHDVNIASLREENSGPVADMARFDAAKARLIALSSDKFDERNLVRYVRRPFDEAWCYFTRVRPIWNEPRPELAEMIRSGTPCLISRSYRERPLEGPHILVSRSLPGATCKTQLTG